MEKSNNELCAPLDKIKGRILFHEPMRNHTTFSIGGLAEILIIPKDLNDIRYSIIYASEAGIPLHFIGNGSKILVSDNGIRGVVVRIAKTLDNVEVSGNRLIAGAGCLLSKIIKIAACKNLSGIEFAAGIPGTLGGAITMNAGTYLGSMSDVVSNVTVIDLHHPLRTVVLRAHECRFGYRTSTFLKNKIIILKAEMKMKRSNQKEIKAKINELLSRRKRTQPIDKNSAGCVFKNPPRVSAGKLIDMTGLKGFRKGNAKISETHANFIINLGDATASDVMFLIELAQEKVKEKYNITLEPEIILMGSFE
jgi:UDP-N-acetylmuramate dehydrogenase